MRTLKVALSEDLFQLLEVVAAEQNASISDVASDAVRRLIASHGERRTATLEAPLEPASGEPA